MPGAVIKALEGQAKRAALAVGKRLKPDLDESGFMRRLEEQWPLAFIEEPHMTVHYVGSGGGAYSNQLLVCVFEDESFREWGQRVMLDAIGGKDDLFGRE